MNRIKLLREELKISQKELALKLGLTEGSVSLYEKGDRKPSYEILIKLSEIFGCSIDYIIGISNDRNNELNSNLLKIGLDMKNYNPPTEEQKKQIEDFAKFVLKDNKKD
jgi:transcriptional regulator with XRE-family HTH domain